MTVKSGTVLGHRVLTEPQVFDLPQEYAGACIKVEVPAGRYPITVEYSSYGGYRYVVCSMPGVIVFDSFYNRIGAHGSMSTGKHTGEEQTYNWQPYEHSVAWGLINDELKNIELAKGVEAREIFFEYQGEQNSTAALLVNGVQIEAR